MATDFERTRDGFELQFGTNHLAHFVLVNRPAPLLVPGAPARLVMMSSGAHRLHDVEMDDPNFERKADDRWDPYGQSKSANALFAIGFERRFGALGVRASTVAPGVIRDTNLHHHLTEEHFQVLRSRQPGVRHLPRKSLARGAATIVWAMTDPSWPVRGGRFLEDCARHGGRLRCAGLSVNRLPSTRALAGKDWRLTLQDGTPMELRFGTRSEMWL